MQWKKIEGTETSLSNNINYCEGQNRCIIINELITFMEQNPS